MNILNPGIYYSTWKNGWCDHPDWEPCIKNEHLTMPLTRWALMPSRAKRLAKLINETPGFIRFVGHSNGNEEFVQALKHIKRPVDEVHMVAAACSSDFEANGLNRTPWVKKLFIHRGECDTVLAGPARWSRMFGGWLGLGFGDLGLVGPKNAKREFEDHVYPGFGHSTFWDEGIIEEFIRRVNGTAQ